MEEEKSILDTVFKTCACCGKTRTLRNYRFLARSEYSDGVVYIADTFSNVCKCCEARPEFQSKENRLANLRAKMARYRENEKARLDKQKLKELNEESGIQVYVK